MDCVNLWLRKNDLVGRKISAGGERCASSSKSREGDSKKGRNVHDDS